MVVRRLKGFVSLAALACAASEQEPRIDAIDPPRGLTDRSTPIAILGQGLDPPLEEREGTLLANAWEGRVGPAELQGLRWIDSNRLEALVPIDMAPGRHDVVLRRGSTELRIADGFVVVGPTAPRVDSAEPTVVPPSGGSVVLRGAGLYLGTTVRVRGEPVAATWMDDRTLGLELPPSGEGDAPLALTTPVGKVWREGLVRYGTR